MITDFLKEAQLNGFWSVLNKSYTLGKTESRNLSLVQILSCWYNVSPFNPFGFQVEFNPLDSGKRV